MAKKETLVELMRLTSDLMQYAIHEEDTNNINGAIAYLRKAVTLNNDNGKNDKINIIFMNINKYMKVSREQIEVEYTRTEEIQYGKMFVFVLFKEIVMLTPYKTAQYFSVNRTTVCRYCNDFKKIQESKQKTKAQEAYMKMFEIIRNAVISDVAVMIEANMSTEEIIGKSKAKTIKQLKYVRKK